MCGAFAEPSDGLEPSTPSLPWYFRGNRSQPTATVFAYLSPFRASLVCHRLRPLGSIKAPSIREFACEQAPTFSSVYQSRQLGITMS
jgi:hypothetical protein